RCAVEQHLAIENHKIGGTEPGGAGDLLGAGRRAVGHPQTELAGRVATLEQGLAIEADQVAGLKSRRVHSADRGEFEGAGRCAVRLPQSALVGSVRPLKENYIFDHVPTLSLRFLALGSAPRLFPLDRFYIKSLPSK